MTFMKEGDLCPYNCGHLFDPHVLIATTGDPMEGGIGLCPEDGCPCFSTWSTRGRPPETVHMLPDDMVAQLRADIQAERRSEVDD